MTHDIEQRLAALEATVLRLQQRSDSESAGRTRAFWIRMTVVVVLVLAYAFFLRSATSFM